jgi:hypothetical protein
VLEGLLGNIKKYELWVLGALVLLGFVLWLRRRFKNARIAREEAAQASSDAAAARQALDSPAEVTVESKKSTDQ